ncbi:MAG: META domain-containing protein [Paramuribaculum sp.]|nr:META domain-containing protein [Paramuribaculum sp.]
MKALYLLIATGIASAAFTGCKSANNIVTDATGQVETITSSETTAMIQHVLYGKWTAVKVGDATVTGENRPYVIFEKDNVNPYIVKYYANNGCNTINGTMAVTKGGKMEAASEAAATMMLCPDAPYEMGVTMALNTVRSYTVEQTSAGYILNFINATGATTMSLQKVKESVLNGAWNVTAIGSESIDSSLELEMVIDLQENKIHGNAGCNVFNGKITENPDAENGVSITDIRTTRMTCPNIAIENRLIDALQHAVNVKTDANDSTAQLLSADGSVLVTLHRQ